MVERLPKTSAAIEKYFAEDAEKRRLLQEKAIAVRRGDYGPDADLTVLEQEASLDDTDRVKITMINDVFREETSEGAITNWEFYRDESKRFGHEYPRRDTERG